MVRHIAVKVLQALGFSALLVFSGFANASEQNFEEWLAEFRTEARAKGISDEIFDAALARAVPIKRVIELDRRQPEFTMTFDEYLSKIASSTRARTAAKMLVEHDEILTKVSKKYGVQKRYIVTFWGVETNFGQYLGSFNVPHALATLAFDGRRSAYFRKELLNALRILEEGHIAPDKMKGSWAGAMGQSQFMPSSFLSYAVDWDGDGKRDIWGTKPDVFASTAYYLSKAGWRDDITWGRQVKLPKGFSMNGKNAKALADDKTRAKLPVWAKAGVRNADGEDLPVKNLTARLVMPAGSDGPAFLVYSNFDSILDWNRSNYYALAIGHLSDKLR
ncbi:lytic murein transglycosylase [Alphaproteobacteria bacterium]|nr:lytic murein transglycosylase [Alphaproteobacteria bacterium]